MSGSLAGFRVLDLGRAIAAPYCAMLLAAEGAEVIKIEPRGGDHARSSAPLVDGRSMYFATYNQGKYGIEIDFRSAAGLRILRELVGQSDVVVQNFRPGTMAAMGLAADEIWSFNPGAVITSISGFGVTGPLRGRLGIDGVAQAMSGLMHLTGDPDGPPQMPGAFLADHAAATYAALGTSMALIERSRTGQGTEVSVDLIDAAISLLGLLTGPVLAGQPGPRRHGNRDPIRAPANVFPSADGEVFLNAASDKIFSRLIEAMDRPDIPEDPRFIDWDSRMANVVDLEHEVGRWTSQFSTADLVAVCEKFGIPCGPVNDVAEALALPGLEEKGMIRTYSGSAARPLRLLGVPVRLSSSEGSAGMLPPPELGQHSVEILTRVLSYDPERIAALIESGVVGSGTAGQRSEAGHDEA